MATYSFLDVSASITGPGGSFQLGSGAGAAEEGITVEMEGDKNTMQQGAGGEVMHSLHASKAGKITVRLLKTSKVNAMLSQMYALQTTSSALHGQNVITVNDTSRGDVASGRKVAFAKHPAGLYAKEGNVVEWEFHSGQTDIMFGTGTPEA